MTNTFEHTEMNDKQQEEADMIRDYASNLEDVFNTAVPSEERSDASRLMNIARTNLEQAVMWAVKAVSRK